MVLIFSLIVGPTFLLLFKMSNLWLDAGNRDYGRESLFLPLKLSNLISASDYVSCRSAWSDRGLFSSFVRESGVWSSLFSRTALARLPAGALVGSRRIPLWFTGALYSGCRLLRSPSFVWTALGNLIFGQRLQTCSLCVYIPPVLNATMEILTASVSPNPNCYFLSCFSLLCCSLEIFSSQKARENIMLACLIYFPHLKDCYPSLLIVLYLISNVL